MDQNALGAVKHSILIACWHMLSTRELYVDLGGDYFRRRDPERVTTRLVAQPEALGHHVVLEELPQAAGPTAIPPWRLFSCQRAKPEARCGAARIGSGRAQWRESDRSQLNPAAARQQRACAFALSEKVVVGR